MFFWTFFFIYFIYVSCRPNITSLVEKYHRAAYLDTQQKLSDASQPSLVLADGAMLPCEPNWHQYTGTGCCFRKTDATSAWYGGTDLCKDLHPEAQMASFHSQDESKFVANKYSSIHAWTGLSQTGTPGVWTYTDGTPDWHWFFAQSSQMTTESSCVEMLDGILVYLFTWSGKKGQTQPYSCTEAIASICKYCPSETTSTTTTTTTTVTTTTTTPTTTTTETTTTATTSTPTTTTETTTTTEATTTTPTTTTTERTTTTEATTAPTTTAPTTTTSTTTPTTTTAETTTTETTTTPTTTSETTTTPFTTTETTTTPTTTIETTTTTTPTTITVPTTTPITTSESTTPTSTTTIPALTTTTETTTTPTTPTATTAMTTSATSTTTVGTTTSTTSTVSSLTPTTPTSTKTSPVTTTTQATSTTTKTSTSTTKLTTAITPASCTSSCPSPTIAFKNKCYKMCSGRVKFEDSCSWCNGTMVTIASKEENDFISRIFGANDQTKSQIWIGNTESSGYSNWISGQNSKPNDGKDYCISMELSAGPTRGKYRYLPCESTVVNSICLNS